MPHNPERRQFLTLAPAAGLLVLGIPAQGARAGFDGPTATPAAPEPGSPVAPAPARAGWPSFPYQHRGLVAEFVGAAHRNEARVRELLDAHPGLVHASHDWGFGDWETALGAASHTGRRSIAELLIERGARVDVFAMAMLGWKDAVRAIVTVAPRSAAAPGPHGLTLAHCARAGGSGADAVVELLKSIPESDRPTPTLSPAPDQIAHYAGIYAFGQAPDDRFTIVLKDTSLQFLSPTGASPRLHTLGPDRFFPAGVPTVRLTFGSDAKAVTITDHDLRVVARRVEN